MAGQVKTKEPKGTGRFYRVGCNQAAAGMEKWDNIVPDGFEDDPAAIAHHDQYGRAYRTTSNGLAAGLDYGTYPPGDE